MGKRAMEKGGKNSLDSICKEGKRVSSMET